MSGWTHPEGPSPVKVPKPYKGQGNVKDQIRRTVMNLPVRVPAMDWTAITTGAKQMFRAYGGGDRGRRSGPVVPVGTETPRPCLLYSVRSGGGSRRWEALPGVLLSHRLEPLGSITPEDLAAEGFEFLPGFKFNWKRRYPTMGWRPWDVVSVVECRPMRTDEMDHFASWAMEMLYGEWLG